jgi:hypothetical protein
MIVVLPQKRILTISVYLSSWSFSVPSVGEGGIHGRKVQGTLKARKEFSLCMGK